MVEASPREVDRPNPIWLRASEDAGFSVDLTWWEVEIERNRQLRQSVHIWHSARSVEQDKQFTIQLTPKQVLKLESLLAITDIPAINVACAMRGMDDISYQFLMINENPDLMIHGTLLYWNYLQKNDPSFDCPALANAIELWRNIKSLLPYPIKR